MQCARTSARAVRGITARPIKSVALAPDDARDSLNFEDSATAFATKPTSELFRAWAIYKSCNIRPLVSNARSLVKVSRTVLGDRITTFALRKTFFEHFCGGETKEDIQDVIKELNSAGVGAILDYAAEADLEAKADPRDLSVPRQRVSARTYDYEGEAECDANADICMHAIEAAGRGGFAAVKCTALGQVELLEHVSSLLHETRRAFRHVAITSGALERTEDFYTSVELDRAQFAEGLRQSGLVLTEARANEIFDKLDTGKSGKVDFVEWTNHLTPRELAYGESELSALQQTRMNEEQIDRFVAMTERLRRLAQAAADRGVRLMVDAEQTYFQPAIDHLVLRLQREFNRDTAVVFNTYQAYLKDARSRFLLDMERARREGFFFGLKAVRGAYMVQERHLAKKKGYKDPIHDAIANTHTCYDGIVATALDNWPNTHIMIATHNEDSVKLAAQHMSAQGIQPGDEGVYFGQLLGMCDHVSFILGAHGYNVFKYVPFGPVNECLAYLIRRAEENSTAMGGIGRDTAMVRAELSRRLLGPRGEPAQLETSA